MGKINTIKSIFLGVIGLGFLSLLTFEAYAAYSNIIGPLAMILILVPHLIKED